MLHKRVSLISLHRALSLVTREETPIPHVREHCDQEVVWTTHWPPVLLQTRKNGREDKWIQLNNGYCDILTQKERWDQQQIIVWWKWPSREVGESRNSWLKGTVALFMEQATLTHTEGDYREGRAAWQRYVLCERGRAPLVCKGPVENNPHINTNAPAQTQR